MDLLNSHNFKVAISYPMYNRSETLLCDSLPKQDKQDALGESKTLDSM